VKNLFLFIAFLAIIASASAQNGQARVINNYYAERIVIFNGDNNKYYEGVDSQSVSEKLHDLISKILLKGNGQEKDIHDIQTQVDEIMLTSKSLENALNEVVQRLRHLDSEQMMTRSALDRIDSFIDETRYLNQHQILSRIGESYFLSDQLSRPESNFFFRTDFKRSNLVAIRSNNVWGFIDEKGRLKIKFQFDYASDFSGDHAVVSKNGETYFIDFTGKRVSDFKIVEQDQSAITEGDIVYSLGDGKFISRIDGRIYLSTYAKHLFVSDPYWKFVSFSHDLLLMDYGAGLDGSDYRLIDLDGEIYHRFDPSCRGVSEISKQGIITVEQFGKWPSTLMLSGYFDVLTKEIIIAPCYSYAELFDHKYAIVRNERYEYGLIDTGNYSILEFGEYRIKRLKEGQLKIRSSMFRKASYYSSNFKHIRGPKLN